MIMGNGYLNKGGLIMKYLFTLRSGADIHAEYLDKLNEKFGMQLSTMDISDDEIVKCEISRTHGIYDKMMIISYLKRVNDDFIVDNVRIFKRIKILKMWKESTKGGFNYENYNE